MRSIATFILFFFVACFSLQAQPLMQASLGAGSAPNRVKIYIRGAATQTPAVISTLQFNIGIPTSVTPKPTMTVVSTTFAGVTWGVTEATEGGYYNYQIVTAASPLQPNIVANTELEVLEVAFTGGPLTANNVSLVTLPDGGLGASNGLSLFLCTGTTRSVGNNLYYTRTGTTVNNQFSYDENGVNTGTTTSTATVSGIILPVTWLDFTAVKKGNQAQLDWSVSNNSNNDRFEVQVSTNSNNFETIGIVANSTNTKYSFIHNNIEKYAAPVLYYRIKQVDKDGTVSFSPVKQIRISDKTAMFSLLDNIGASTLLQLRINATNNGKAVATVYNMNGQAVKTVDVQWGTGTTQKQIQLPALAAGNYMLHVNTDDGIIRLPFTRM